MQGKAVLNPDFRSLADWIKAKYEVLPVNIIYDRIEEGKLPRLEICLEHQTEEALFSNKDGYSYNKIRQQAIAQKFQQLMQEQRLEKPKGLFHLLSPGKYVTENVWVIFSAFDKLAKAEANENIPATAIDQLKQQFSDEGLWEISRFFGYTTFFVRTQEQAKAIKDSETLKRWTDAYFQLLKQYDEFNYFERTTFSLIIDSEENFINNYQGNWYYYYK